MKRAEDPVGPENKSWFDRMLAARGDGPVVCAWGVHGEHMAQDLTVLGWLESDGIKPLALGMTRNGHPKHPLYLSCSDQMILFARRR